MTLCEIGEMIMGLQARTDLHDNTIHAVLIDMEVPELKIACGFHHAEVMAEKNLINTTKR